MVSALVAAVDLPLVGGIGQSVQRPRSADQVERRYDLAIGQLVIDLRDLDLSAGERVTIRGRVGMGELVVELPEGIQVYARARAALGDVQVLGEQSSGLGAERVVADLGTPAGHQITLDLSAGIGSVKVNQ